ncbi:MAG: NAD(P)-dependent oxidoreductase [Halobacteriaceae archaeon]
MRHVGLIGVGFIGKLFVDDLTEAGYPLTVHDIDESAVEYATERGATAGGGPAAVAEAADVLLLALPGHPEVRSVLAEEGAVDALDAGDLVVDTTTVGPRAAEEFEALCADRGVDYLAAPLTRAAPTPGVHLMVGGDEAVYERAGEFLDDVSTARTRIGDVYQAQSFKLMIQMRYAGQMALDAEVVEFGRDRGVDPEVMNEFLGMDVDERYFSGDFSQGIEGLGGLRIWHKDLGYALDLSRETNTALPLTSEVHEAYKDTLRNLDPDEGHAATLIRHWMRLNGADDADRYGGEDGG